MNDQSRPLQGRVVKNSEKLSKKILEFLRNSGLIIPVNDEFWIYSASAESQLTKLISDELFPSSPSIQGVPVTSGGSEESGVKSIQHGVRRQPRVGDQE